MSTAVVLTLVMAGCNAQDPEKPPAQSPSASAPAGLGTYYNQKIDWSDCGGGFQCATADVPVDYTKPADRQLKLSLIRLPAQDPSRRIGSLFTNPGGPGGSGVEFIRSTGRAFGADLRSRFDIIGFDPRGVGKSDPVRCMDGPQLDRFFATDASPDDQSEIDKVSAESRTYADNCKAKAPDRLPYVGTLNAARDMDVLRAALGDQKMTYYGASYGTYLGSFYAEQFPQNVRALVLDGAVDPKESSTQTLVEQSKGFETALRAFVADCVKLPDCPLGTDPTAALAKIAALQKKADQKPLTNNRDSRPVTETLVTMGIALALYLKQLWPTLRQALTQAIQNGDGTFLLALADQMVEREQNGTYSNQTDANMAVNCVDKPSPPDVATYKKSVDEAAKASPHFGPFVVWGGLPCVYWPAKTKQQPKPITAKGSAPILVIGTLRDPATPYKWAQSLAAQLDSGVLLSLDGDGHTAYLQGNSCIIQATDQYLVTAKPPKDGTLCR
ncbi:alpha/beta hydrolase [Actinomadura rudentiformis]|uniref:Alpha/beta hydrolase n=1 Tax=Actinomadura rudentiformis TaxID=359158 RepID=A0A6H9Z6P6_9ACTN|nr:alpha/beta hydrolase [Actinomadura rudentiformis]KAB2350840.1 alpha/beta hydrolase [Actinomadura rudentiformis]